MNHKYFKCARILLHRKGVDPEFLKNYKPVIRDTILANMHDLIDIDHDLQELQKNPIRNQKKFTKEN